MEMNVCALVDAWRELGCTPHEVDLFCDIAMEGDRGRADYHGIPIEIPERMGKGDAHCRMLLQGSLQRSTSMSMPARTPGDGADRGQP